jgi:hypothetical protein
MAASLRILFILLCQELNKLLNSQNEFRFCCRQIYKKIPLVYNYDWVTEEIIQPFLYHSNQMETSHENTITDFYSLTGNKGRAQMMLNSQLNSAG